MTHPFGFVIQGNDSQLNKVALEAYLREAQPPSCTMLNNDDYAAYLKTNVSPATEFYLRHYDDDGDEGDWKQYSPSGYFDLYEKTTRGGLLGLQLWNEPGFGRDIVARANEFIREGLRRGVRLSLFGAAVGTTPATAAEWAAWPEYRDFAELVGTNPGKVCYDSHEYYAAVWTSGMVKADTQSGEVLYFATKLLTPTQWPKSLSELTGLYHCGRVKGFADYCKSKGWQPTIDISEAGPDNVSEGGGALDQWLKALPADKRQHVKGFKTLETWYRRIYPQWAPAETNARMLSELWRVVWQPLGVRSVRLFTYGNSGRGGNPDWFDHDYMENPDYLKAVRDITTGAPVEPPKPSPPEAPAAGWYTLHVSGDYMNLRRSPEIADNIIDTIPNGAVIVVLPCEVCKGGGYRWLQVNVPFRHKTGYIALLPGMRFEKHPTLDDLPVVPPQPDVLSEWAKEVKSALEKASTQLEVVQTALDGLYADMNALQVLIRNKPTTG